MNKIIRSLAFAGAALFSVTAAQTVKAADFTLSSTAFEDGGVLALKNAGGDKSHPNCIGDNISPPLSWANPPDGTKSYALLLFDPEGANGLGASHWVAYGIPVSVTGFAEGEVGKTSDKYVGGKNIAGLPYYGGPCPGPGGWHHYAFTLIATDLEPTALAPGLTRDELLAALAKHNKGAAGLIGKFRHP